MRRSLLFLVCFLFCFGAFAAGDTPIKNLKLVGNANLNGYGFTNGFIGSDVIIQGMSNDWAQILNMTGYWNEAWEWVDENSNEVEYGLSRYDSWDESIGTANWASNAAYWSSNMTVWLSNNVFYTSVFTNWLHTNTYVKVESDPIFYGWSNAWHSKVTNSITNSQSGVAFNGITLNNGSDLVGSSIFTTNPSFSSAATAPSLGWAGIAMTPSASKVAAVVGGGYIYVSDDGGVSWSSRGLSRNWIDIAVSSDGIHLAASASGYYIYTSSDGGVSWIARDTASTHSWQGVASSSNGQKLVGVYLGAPSSQGIRTSVDYGTNWVARGPSLATPYWWGVASSDDGVKLVAVVYGGRIYTSSDAGTNWVARESNRNWFDVTSSADGTKLAAIVENGQIYTSVDSGVSWTARASSLDWYDITSSSDGTKLVAVVDGSGRIYTSSDAGTNWVARESNRNWKGVASSADGEKVFATSVGNIYAMELDYTPSSEIHNFDQIGSSTNPVKRIYARDVYIESNTLYFGSQSLSIEQNGDLAYNGNPLVSTSGVLIASDTNSLLQISNEVQRATIAESNLQIQITANAGYTNKANIAYGWGNHASIGYMMYSVFTNWLKTNTLVEVESDPIFAGWSNVWHRKVQTSVTNNQSGVNFGSLTVQNNAVSTNTLDQITSLINSRVAGYSNYVNIIYVSIFDYNAGTNYLQSQITANAGFTNKANIAYSWGNHSTNGYATTGWVDQAFYPRSNPSNFLSSFSELDPIFGGWSNIWHYRVAISLTNETDPVWSSEKTNYALDIDLENETNRAQVAEASLANFTNKADVAYSWGNHSTNGYATTGLVAITYVSIFDYNAGTNFLQGQITENAGYTNEAHVAYGWGNHANAGYASTTLVNAVSQQVADVRSNTNNYQLAYSWGDHSLVGYMLYSSWTNWQDTNTYVKVELDPVFGGWSNVWQEVVENAVTNETDPVWTVDKPNYATMIQLAEKVSTNDAKYQAAITNETDPVFIAWSNLWQITISSAITNESDPIFIAWSNLWHTKVEQALTNESDPIFIAWSNLWHTKVEQAITNESDPIFTGWSNVWQQVVENAVTNEVDPFLKAWTNTPTLEKTLVFSGGKGPTNAVYGFTNQTWFSTGTHSSGSNGFYLASGTNRFWILVPIVP